MPGSAKERVLMLYFNTNVGATLLPEIRPKFDTLRRAPPPLSKNPPIPKGFFWTEVTPTELQLPVPSASAIGKPNPD